MQIPPRPAPSVTLDATKVYTLPELVDVAEHNNPDTRVSWENAKARAADLGISKSTLYPTLAAVVLADTARNGIFFGPYFVRQTVESYAPTFVVDYAIFDLQRSQEIAISRNELLVANFQFNDTHRKIIFQVMDAYYRLLDTKGQQEAAEANLKNAQTVREAAEARLQNGLATLPDVLESRSAEAQADYDLQAAIGATEIAYGDLATSLGLSPLAKFKVESIHDIKMPDQIVDTVEKSIDKALSQRPDLLERVAELRATQAEVELRQASVCSQADFQRAGRRGERVWQAISVAERGSVFRDVAAVGRGAELVVDTVRWPGARKSSGESESGSEAGRSEHRRDSRPDREPGVGGVFHGAHGATPTEGRGRTAGVGDGVVQCRAGVLQLWRAQPD